MTRAVLSASALFLALLGLAGTFAPHELLRLLGAAATGALPVVVQLTAALYLGFAMQNWMARESLIGGIYHRPLAIGNLVHFVIGAFALARYAASARPSAIVIGLTVAYAVFAVAFGKIVFTSPVKRATGES